jgi:hypothetical protein
VIGYSDWRVLSNRGMSVEYSATCCQWPAVSASSGDHVAGQQVISIREVTSAIVAPASKQGPSRAHCPCDALVLIMCCPRAAHTPAPVTPL